jgi:hypothetical protein
MGRPFATRFATQLGGTGRYGSGYSHAAMPENPQKSGRQETGSYAPGRALTIYETAPFAGIPPRATARVGPAEARLV